MDTHPAIPRIYTLTMAIKNNQEKGGKGRDSFMFFYFSLLHFSPFSLAPDIFFY